MRWTVISYYLGLFLRIFSGLLLVPVAVGKYYGESFVLLEPFLLSAFLSIVMALVLTRLGRVDRPEVMEAMIAAAIGWIIAVALGAIPTMLIGDVAFIDAYFDAMSGFTTTGMIIVSNAGFPRSLLFWRMFMQWIGGLGIITFFVTVLVESGGVANRLVAVESGQTDSGSIRASLFNAIKSMWYVYILLTLVEIALLHYFDVPAFHAVTHAMATIPTGGFSSVPDLPGLLTPGARATLTVFMFLGGTNFLLIYSVLKGNVRRMLSNYEFRLYVGIVATAIVLVTADLFLNGGMDAMSAAENGIFHAVSYLTSAGFELQKLESMPTFTQGLAMFLMMLGASLGSTTGGIKILRFGIMLKVIKQQVKAMTLPPTVLNPVTVGRKIIDDDEIRQILAIIFMWLLVIILGGLLTLWFTGYGIGASLQLTVSAAGTMGPTIVPGAELTALPAVVKIGLMLAMLAGRLEMLPLLALLNVRLAKKFT